MNFYEHHLGDYLRDTAHLTMMEDAAYRRLLDAYYIREAPLPADVKACQKLARAQSAAERQAVADVLDEFFDLREDGHHQKRADEAIAQFHEDEPDREARRESGRERQRRARERRRTLFAQLRELGIVPDYNATVTHIEQLLSRALARGGNAPVTRDNTASQSPVPSPQSPIQESPTHPARAHDGAQPAFRALPEPGDPPNLEQLLVPTCDRQAMDAWLQHRTAKGKPLAGHEIIAAGKLLAGMGDPESQRSAVQHCVANGFAHLRLADGRTGKANGYPPARKARTADEIEADYRARGLDPTTGEPIHATG